MARLSWTTAVLALALGAAFAPPAWARGARPSAATEEEKNEARAFFQTAMEAHNDKRFEEALQGFRDSYDKVASPNTHLMIVRELASLGRNAEAYREAQITAREARLEAETDPKYEQTVQAAEQEIERLRPKVGLLTVRGTADAPNDATLTVGGNPVDISEWNEPIAVEPGTVTVELSGRPSQEVTVEAGGEATVDLTPAAIAEPEVTPAKPEEPTEAESFIMDNRRNIAYGAFGLGAANLIVYGVLGGLALKKHSDIEEQCTPEKVCPIALQQEADTGKDYRTMANVAFGIGVVAVVAGAAFLTWDLLDPADEADDTQAKLRVGPGSVGVELAF